METFHIQYIIWKDITFLYFIRRYFLCGNRSIKTHWSWRKGGNLVSEEDISYFKLNWISSSNIIFIFLNGKVYNISFSTVSHILGRNVIPTYISFLDALASLVAGVITLAIGQTVRANTSSRLVWKDIPWIYVVYGKIFHAKMFYILFDASPIASLSLPQGGA